MASPSTILHLKEQFEQIETLIMPCEHHDFPWNSWWRVSAVFVSHHAWWVPDG